MTIRVEVVMAWPRHFDAVALSLPDGSTVAHAITAAALPDAQAVNGYAIFGVLAGLATALRDGDRVELLRPLEADPKDARRRRAKRPDR